MTRTMIWPRPIITCLEQIKKLKYLAELTFEGMHQLTSCKNRLQTMTNGNHLKKEYACQNGEEILDGDHTENPRTERATDG